MAEDRTHEGPPPKPFSKEHRQAERAKVVRHSRLPGPFYDYAQRGRREATLVSLLQICLVIGGTLLAAKLVTGSWFPRLIAFVVLAVSLAVQAANRYVNARAGRT